MYKIIGADGKEYGPVTQEQLLQWVREGRVNVQTQVQAAGATDWRPLSAHPELAGGAAAPPPLAAGLPVDAAALRSTIEARDYVVDIGGWVRRGWELVKANAGLLIGGTLLSLVIQGAVGAIPFLGGIASLILQGALIGGMYWLFLRCLRGEAAGIGDIFAGFQRGFVNLMLTNIVTGLLVGVCLLPGAVVLGIGLMLHLAAKSPAGIPVAIGGGVLLLCLLPVAIYLALCFAFALPLVIDRQLGFWDAMQLSRHMVRKHWWGIFGAGIVFGLVGAAGLLACLVGVVVTMPIVIAAWMCAYEDIFGERPAQVG